MIGIGDLKDGDILISEDSKKANILQSQYCSVWSSPLITYDSNQMYDFLVLATNVRMKPHIYANMMMRLIIL